MALKNQKKSKVYSDGNIEEKIIKYLKINGEQGILEKFDDGNVFHNFTPIRENLINWYDFKKNASVLEIGAGMGALTKFLCKKVKKVTAVEMSPKRAEIIKIRCKENDNLVVLMDDINCLKVNEKFDYILLIGVLEYAGIGKKNVSKAQFEMLKKIIEFLKDDGKLIIGIENKFGLKYWCGATEDHTGIPFDGISGYIHGGETTRYNDKGVRTLSKIELDNLLENVGLKYKRHYYPLPDYKFPNVIYSENKIPNSSEIKDIKFSYSEESTLIADENKLYPEVIENNCFEFFANSFLVEASKQKLEQKYAIFASLKRDYKNKYRIITLIDNENKVKKIPVYEESEQHLKDSLNNINELKQRGINVINVENKYNLYEYNFVDSPRADIVFKKLLEKNDFEKIKNLIDKLKKNNLLSSEKSFNKINGICKKIKLDNTKVDFGVILKHGFIDLTLVNSFYINDELYFFDQEWKMEDIPLNYILYRSIKTAYGNNKYDISLNDILKYLKISKEEIEIYNKFEKKILEEMMDDNSCNIFDKGMYQERLLLSSKIDDRLKEKDAHIEQLIESERKLNSELKNKEGHIEQLLESERKLNNKVREKENEIREKENEIKDKENEIKDKENEIRNKNGHINLLLESERELERIKNSRSWRYMTYIWKFRDKVLPYKSKRRLFIKLMVKAVKHPVEFAKKCTPKRIGKFFYYLNREGVSNVSLRLDECVVGDCNERLSLNLSNINEKEVYKISDFEKLKFEKVENPKVSIIIPVYNQIKYTYLCLKSILENTRGITYEIIIADDCSTDITKDITKFVENINVIIPDKNLRFLKNCNNASKHAKGEYILFLNNDTQVQENWLISLVELIESDSLIGMVGSKFVYPDGRLQEAGGIIWDDASAWNYGRLSDPKDPEYSYVKECDYISGAAIMIRKELWKEIGGFDERFVPAYCEDSDLAFEVRKHGYKVMLQPNSIVVHFEGISNGTDTSNGQKSYQIVNTEKFKKKWNEELKKQFKNGENVFLARDRSKDKQHVLVIDHYVPQYDKDAGSRTVFQYLSLLACMGYAVSFIGDNFYRHEPYTTKLQQMGIEVLYGSYYANNWEKWIQENNEFFDFILLNRPHISVKYIDYLKEHTKAKIIYYGHDLHFLREMREYKLTGEQRLLKSSDEWKKREFDLFKKSDVILYPSEVEVNEIKKYDSSLDVRKLPAYIMESKRNILPINNRKDLLFVGGFGHDPNVDGIVWFCERIFPMVIEKDPNIKLNIVGSKAPDKVLDLKSDNINVLGFVSDEELAQLYRKCRISVAPLRYGAGIKGKIIEAIANGIPVVTTTCGVEGIENKDNFIIVDDDCNKFAQNILDLYYDEVLIEKNINNGFKFIDEYYSSKSAEKFIKELFK